MSRIRPVTKIAWLLLYTLFSIPDLIWSQQDYLSTHYRKLDTLIPMRDGKNLYTVIYLIL